MKKLTIIWVVVLLMMIICFSQSVFGDGKFYYREHIPNEIPYQRAILAYGNGEEFLLLQTKYQVSNNGTLEDFGWIVPVPSLPELGSMEPADAQDIFFNLARWTEPNIVQMIWFYSVLALVLVVAVVGLFIVGIYQSWCRKRIFNRPLLYAISLSIMFALIGIMPTSRKVGISSVDIVREQQVGVYEAKVIQATNASDLVQWLTENGFYFDDTDTAVFDDYIQKNWYFVTAKISATASSKVNSSDGLVAPLILQFQSNEAIYPFALTATSGTKTEVLLYVLSTYPMLTDNHLPLEAAQRHSIKDILYSEYPKFWIEYRNDPRDLSSVDFWRERADSLYPEMELSLTQFCIDNLLPNEHDNISLTKLKGRLDPSKFKDDLILHEEPQQDSYRKTVYRW